MNDIMKSFRRYILPLGAASLLILLALLADSLYFSDFEYRYRTRLVNKILHEKETLMDELLGSMKSVVATENHHGSEPEKDIFATAARNNITILEFPGHRLTYWSDNDFDVPEMYDDSLYSRPLVFLQNGWFLPAAVETANGKIVGLLRVRMDYSLKNEIIKSGFVSDFRLPENVGFSIDAGASPFHVSNRSGEFLFSLIFPEIKEPTGLIIIPLLLWAAAFILILIVFYRVIRNVAGRYGGLLATLLAIAGCSGLYFLIIFAGPPDVFPLTELFSPYRFSLNSFVPTTGHLLIMGILCVFVAGVFHRYFPFRPAGDEPDWKDYIRSAAAFIIASVLLSVVHLLFRSLVLTSGINFQPFRVLELSFMSLAGFLAIFMIMLLPVLFMQRFMSSVKEHRTSFVLMAMMPSLVLIAILFRNDLRSFYAAELFFIFLTAGVWFSLKRQAGAFSQTVVFSFIFGLYSLYLITVFTEEKLTTNNKIQAVSFSTENDPEAEQLLLDLWPSISNDTTLARMMKSESFNLNNEDVANISDYLRETYFHGYWANFNFNVIPCRDDEPLEVGPGHEVFPVCFNFFDERIKRDGHRLSGTGFYFIDNQRGRSFYLGRLIYRARSNYLHGLFIELYGDVNVFQPGYSALLLDEKFKGYAGLRDYSFAKYINGEIVLRAGEFPYPKTDGQYTENVKEYKVFRDGDYRHVLYKNGNSTVIISRPLITAGDMIISFAYLFAFILLFSNITVLLVRPPRIKKGLFNFRQKLQLSYIVILLFSFILIGVVVAYLTINSYKNRHYENIKEKLNSVNLELDSRLSNEKRLDSNWRNRNYSSLNDLMISLSNIFNTDINLYSVDGSMLATSRPEIFIRNLTSSRINNEAWTRLRDQGMTEFYQRENIGSLGYLSAYMPFFNSEDVVLAYVNLPYFRIQSVLAREISNLIVAVVNFALLLILVTMGIAVVISGRITAPLSMLGKGLASVQLGRKTEHLTYSGNDEISELVRQYNRMVDELEDSARKLANSEREYAWREMAKQIAHEIKNPLTPMKLNVQQLLKSWNDKAPDFNERLEHFSKNQIEYIDNLSSIASAFSSFAKMPTANPSEVDLPDQIRITLELFKDDEDITFNVEWPEEKKVVVWADKEHLNGIFSNLIKNGIQSIPPGRKGIIGVKIEVRRDRVIVSFSDNGSGIPKEVQAKLFTPNFTTKSSGTGLGLSIVRKYVETAGGAIWFESAMGKGSTFYVDLPLKYTVEKHG